MHYTKMKCLICLILLVGTLTLVSAVDIESGTVLNTSISNSSMTFSSGIVVDELNIEDSNITLSNITCGDGYYSTISDLFWNDTNSNLDSVYFCGMNVLLKLNENSGTTAYDVSGNGNNGTITGATWNDDGINNTLTRDVDYTYTGQLFTLLNSDYSWSEVKALFRTETAKTTQTTNILNNITGGVESFFSNAGTWFALLAIVVIILIVVIVMKSANNLSESRGGL